MPNTSHNDDRIEAKFRELRGLREGALVAYLTGGDPDPKTFLANSTALIEGGADIVEIGIPFSDPIADGPVIQASSMRALSNGTTPLVVLNMIRELSTQFPVPFVVLSYYNPILAMGLDRFLQKARESGVDGIVVPDLPVEESEEFRNISLKHNVDNIYLAAPNTSRTRLRTVLDKSKGFLYLVSIYGVTGPRDSLSPQALEAVRAVKFLARGKIPVSAGFGISQPEHVSAVIQSGADGAIVGSALVRIVGNHLDDPSQAETQLKKTVQSLKEATRLSSKLE
ncbi:tryptophan synthase subunit alpha [Candidatus Bathyarchaeota archaeon]|nr:MAG: tryptophan synthase subunit alpha [Candidatus Bathyarchaeota archaeon]